MASQSTVDLLGQLLASRKARVDELLTLADSSKVVKAACKVQLEAMQARLASGQAVQEALRECL